MAEDKRNVTNSPLTLQDHDSVVLDMHLKGAALYLSKKADKALKDGVSTIKIRLKEGSTDCYPNVCVPLAGTIDYYRKMHGINFVAAKSWKQAKMLSLSGTIKPYELDKLSPPSSFLNKVWKFSYETHYDIVSGVIDSLRRSAVMGKDVIHGFELALNEVTDNILQHSVSKDEDEEPEGYLMAQYHRNEGKIVAAVFDTGQGIMASLREGGVAVHTAEEALQKAMRRGFTSGNGAGNGLWIMESIILASAGSLEVISDGARHTLRNTDPAFPRLSSSNVVKFKTGTTLVDFQIDSQGDISLAAALGSQPSDLWTEDHLLDDEEGVIVSVAKESRGCGSREEGKRFSNIVCNLCKLEPGKCVLDFSGVSIVSASFADQIISDLVHALSFLGFMDRIVFAGLSSSCAMVFNESFKTRFFNESNNI